MILRISKVEYDDGNGEENLSHCLTSLIFKKLSVSTKKFWGEDTGNGRMLYLPRF